MDPLALAGALATVVGLLANFKDERSGASLEEFMSWMREQHQDTLAASIDQNHLLQQALSSLLAINHDELVERLHSITAQLSEIARRVDGFADLDAILGSSSKISDQARSVLCQIASSGASFVMQHKVYGSTGFLLMGGSTSGDIQATEPRFLEEDFAALVSAGYLRVDYTSNGKPRYTITRAGIGAANAASIG